VSRKSIPSEVMSQLFGGLYKEAKRQIFGGGKKKKRSEQVHNHYHIYPDKKYYRK
jgi:hypothetical protein